MTSLDAKGRRPSAKIVIPDADKGSGKAAKTGPAISDQQAEKFIGDIQYPDNGSGPSIREEALAGINQALGKMDSGGSSLYHDDLSITVDGKASNR